MRQIRKSPLIWRLAALVAQPSTWAARRAGGGSTTPDVQAGGNRAASG